MNMEEFDRLKAFLNELDFTALCEGEAARDKPVQPEVTPPQSLR